MLPEKIDKSAHLWLFHIYIYIYLYITSLPRPRCFGSQRPLNENHPFWEPFWFPFSCAWPLVYTSDSFDAILVALRVPKVLLWDDFWWLLGVPARMWESSSRCSLSTIWRVPEGQKIDVFLRWASRPSPRASFDNFSRSGEPNVVPLASQMLPKSHETHPMFLFWAELLQMRVPGCLLGSIWASFWCVLGAIWRYLEEQN